MKTYKAHLTGAQQHHTIQC